MTFSKYLRDHAGWLFIGCFLIITLEVFLLMLNGATALRIYVAVVVVVLVILGMYIDYRKMKKFLDSLEEGIEELDKKYLLPELINNDENEEQHLIVYILREMENAMADNVSEYKRKSENYKNYIETWVHEVKIPIATAGMIAENHRDESIRDTKIENEIKRIQNYVEQALFYARSEAVEKDYFIKEVDLEDIVSTVIADKRLILREKRAGIDIHDMETEKKVCSDGKWLSFVISQIVENSIKYAKEGEPPKIEIFVTHEDEKTALHIKDYGRGMKSGEVSRAFEKGFTGTNGRNVSSSTGMGLFLCNRLCERLQHKLLIKSVEGEGTELIIVF